jgi:hypothetical protein
MDISLSPLSAISSREQMQQVARLLDHLVGAGEQRWRHLDLVLLDFDLLLLLRHLRRLWQADAQDALVDSGVLRASVKQFTHLPSFAP